jgi:hypothetical protein
MVASQDMQSPAAMQRKLGEQAPIVKIVLSSCVFGSFGHMILLTIDFL